MPTPFKPPSAKPETKLLDAKDTVLEQIRRILEVYNYRESDIPLAHEYWKLKNQV